MGVGGSWGWGGSRRSCCRMIPKSPRKGCLSPGWGRGAGVGGSQSPQVWAWYHSEGQRRSWCQPVTGRCEPQWHLVLGSRSGCGMENPTCAQSGACGTDWKCPSPSGSPLLKLCWTKRLVCLPPPEPTDLHPPIWPPAMSPQPPSLLGTQPSPSEHRAGGSPGASWVPGGRAERRGQRSQGTGSAA